MKLPVILCLAATALLAAPMDAGAGQAGGERAPLQPAQVGQAPGAIPQARPLLVATGDSYTRRTGCAGSLAECEAKGMIPHELSYSTWLNGASRYAIALVENTGRGSDTCTVQAPFDNGLNRGEPRGLVAQVAPRITSRGGDVASILVGINDVNSWGVDGDALAACLVSLYDQVTATGMAVVAMTYPPVAADTRVWKALPAAQASANVAIVNRAVRTAVAQHNAALPGRPVRLADTHRAWTGAEVAAMTSDGAHPNQAGAQRLARAWVAEVCATQALACAPRR